MSEEFEREVLPKVPLDRRAFLKKMVVSAAFAAPVIASFNMIGLDAGTAHGLTTNSTRQVLLCHRKKDQLTLLQNRLAQVAPPGSDPTSDRIRAQLEKQIANVQAFIAANC